MDESKNVIQERILRDMSEGIMVIGLDGRIECVNPKACTILSLSESNTVGKSFAALFFQYEENDAFTQLILDAVYDRQIQHTAVVPYFDGACSRYLHVTTSFLRDEERNVGVIAVLTDISELVRLREAVEEKNRQVVSLLDSMVRALSCAIEERSRYTANHTRNMVRVAERFLDWLEGTPRRFSEGDRRAFLMSVWLHDVGKLTVPLRVMDKADRLGHRLSEVMARLRLIRLLNRLAEAEGRIDSAEAAQRLRDLEEARGFIERINKAGFLPDEDYERVQELARRTYTDELGGVHPWITEEERLCLSIRQGTLTTREREVIEGHAAATRRILSQIDFPPPYDNVPAWAGEHHEQLSGKGYPEHLTLERIPTEVRLLTILDIFEALTAKDRPYKKPMPAEKALSILRGMVEDGALDGGLLDLFEKSGAWRETDGYAP